MSDIGDRIKLMRVRNKMSQRALARASGLSQAHLSNIENGKRDNPGSDTLAAIAAALDVALSWLMTGAGDPWPPKIAFPGALPTLATTLPGFVSRLTETGLLAWASRQPPEKVPTVEEACSALAYFAPDFDPGKVDWDDFFESRRAFARFGAPQGYVEPRAFAADLVALAEEGEARAELDRKSEAERAEEVARRRQAEREARWDRDRLETLQRRMIAGFGGGASARATSHGNFLVTLPNGRTATVVTEVSAGPPDDWAQAAVERLMQAHPELAKKR